MKRIVNFVSIIGIHFLMLLLHIHVHTQWIEASFLKQKNERTLEQLRIEQQKYLTQLYALQDHTRIKEYAQNHLHMKPVRLNQIKRLSAYDW